MKNLIEEFKKITAGKEDWVVTFSLVVLLVIIILFKRGISDGIQVLLYLFMIGFICHFSINSFYVFFRKKKISVLYLISTLLGFSYLVYFYFKVELKYFLAYIGVCALMSVFFFVITYSRKS